MIFPELDGTRVELVAAAMSVALEESPSVRRWKLQAVTQACLGHQA